MSGLQEKLITNWLDSTTERAYQHPFCAMLVAEGHKLVHSTRHCAMELGKDVIAISPDGTVCAYQLKSSDSAKHGVGEWHKEICGQINSLVNLPVKHPEVSESMGWHQSFFVTNRELHEEFSRAVNDFNEGQIKAGYANRQVKVISRGEMLNRFLAQGSVWPSELEDLKSLLEIMTCDGRERLDRGKMAGLLEKTFGVSNEGVESRESNADGLRLLASASLLYAHALQPWRDAGNHVALVYGWQVFCSYILAVSEAWGINVAKWMPIYMSAFDASRMALEDLAGEARGLELKNELDAHLDKPFDFHRFRVTEILGLMATRCFLADEEALGGALEDFFEIFAAHISDIALWGEASVPFLMALAFALDRFSMEPASIGLVVMCAFSLIRSNQRDSDQPLANVYRLDTWVMGQTFGIDEPAQEQFSGMSWTCESLVHFLSRREQKNILTKLWPKYAKLMAMSYTPPDTLSFHRWRSRAGKRFGAFPKPTKQWSDLIAESMVLNEHVIPPFYHDKPGHLLMFVLTYPHRYTSNVAHFLDRSLPGFPSGA